MYQHQLKGFVSDSKRTLSEYRNRKFFTSWKGKTVVMAFLPFYMIFNPKKKNISILVALSAPLVAGTLHV